jgi:hypothetical protein
MIAKTIFFFFVLPAKRHRHGRGYRICPQTSHKHTHTT